jgi:hypothetical protein
MCGVHSKEALYKPECALIGAKYVLILDFSTFRAVINTFPFLSYSVYDAVQPKQTKMVSNKTVRTFPSLRNVWQVMLPGKCYSSLSQAH